MVRELEPCLASASLWHSVVLVSPRPDSCGKLQILRLYLGSDETMWDLFAREMQQYLFLLVHDLAHLERVAVADSAL